MTKSANFKPLHERQTFKIVYEVFNNVGKPANTLVVDYACKYIGGGALGEGFVQEEQMFNQSADLMLQLYDRKVTYRRADVISEWQVMTFEGVYFDTWWNREACALMLDLPLGSIQWKQSKAMTVIAVDAPHLHIQLHYTKHQILMLARKIKMVYLAAIRLECSTILTGLLGGGAYMGQPSARVAFALAFGARGGRDRDNLSQQDPRVAQPGEVGGNGAADG